jgi:hypothetical protein
MEQVWKEVAVASFKALSHILHGVTEESHKKSQSGWSQLRFILGAYKM